MNESQNLARKAWGQYKKVLAANKSLRLQREELLAALKDLQKQLHANLKMDVKKHYSLMVADAQASKAIFNATERQ